MSSCASEAAARVILRERSGRARHPARAKRPRASSCASEAAARVILSERSGPARHPERAKRV